MFFIARVYIPVTGRISIVCDEYFSRECSIWGHCGRI